MPVTYRHFGGAAAGPDPAKPHQRRLSLAGRRLGDAAYPAQGGQSDTLCHCSQGRQLDLEAEDTAEVIHLMTALDGINLRYGRATMKMASAGLSGDRRI